MISSNDGFAKGTARSARRALASARMPRLAIEPAQTGDWQTRA
jgi:hypothetical protein